MFTVDASFGISITRGDTATLEIAFDGDAPGDGDLVVAALKKTANGKPYWQKELEPENGAYLMQIDSEDTERLPFGAYLWDLRILYADGQITTPFPPAPFNILEVVTPKPEEGGA